jgi:hypothetical protein
MPALLISLPERGKEIAGSTLCIDARNAADERVLVIRALNPTEKVIQRELDTVSVVKTIVQYCIQAAEKSRETDPDDPVIEIRLCYDHSGGHSTNRLPVFEAEGKLLKTEWPDNTGNTGLQESSETKFNNYDIYKPGQTRVIWRKEAAKEGGMSKFSN